MKYGLLAEEQPYTARFKKPSKGIPSTKYRSISILSVSSKVRSVHIIQRHQYDFRQKSCGDFQATCNSLCQEEAQTTLIIHCQSR